MSVDPHGVFAILSFFFFFFLRAALTEWECAANQHWQLANGRLPGGDSDRRINKRSLPPGSARTTSGQVVMRPKRWAVSQQQAPHRQARRPGSGRTKTGIDRSGKKSNFFTLNQDDLFYSN